MGYSDMNRWSHRLTRLIMQLLYELLEQGENILKEKHWIINNFNICVYLSVSFLTCVCMQIM